MGEFIHKPRNLYFANLTCQKSQFFGVLFQCWKWISPSTFEDKSTSLHIWETCLVFMQLALNPALFRGFRGSRI